jgi:hypothetical protein
MRTTLVIDDDVLDDARRIAKAEGVTLGAVVSDLARRSLRPVGIASSDGIPMFDVPADAPPITAEDVARARDDDA